MCGKASSDPQLNWRLAASRRGTRSRLEWGIDAPDRASQGRVSIKGPVAGGYCSHKSGALCCGLNPVVLIGRELGKPHIPHTPTTDEWKGANSVAQLASQAKAGQRRVEALPDGSRIAPGTATCMVCSQGII